MLGSLPARAAFLSLAMLATLLVAWQLAVSGRGATQAMDPEYAKLMGLTATQGKSAMPGPLEVGTKLWEHLRHPFYDRGPNDKGGGIQLAYSLARLLAGWAVAPRSEKVLSCWTPVGLP